MNTAAKPFDHSSFVGVWRYAGRVDTRPDGSAAPTSALSELQGLLIYTADGFMSVNIMPTIRSWSTAGATVDELRETVGHGAAYSGRYAVDAATRTVTHRTSVSVDPAYQGQDLVRTYVLDGDSLQLSGTFPYQGETIHFVITWIRASGAPASSTW